MSPIQPGSIKETECRGPVIKTSRPRRSDSDVFPRGGRPTTSARRFIWPLVLSNTTAASCVILLFFGQFEVAKRGAPTDNLDRGGNSGLSGAHSEPPRRGHAHPAGPMRLESGRRAEGGGADDVVAQVATPEATMPGDARADQDGRAEENDAPPNPPRVAAKLVNAEAVAGSPYGVAKVEILFGDENTPTWRADKTAFLNEPSGRIRYPAFAHGFRTVDGESTSQLDELTVYFLFDGDDPLSNLKLSWVDSKPIEFETVEVESDAARRDELLREWWTRYNASPDVTRGERRIRGRLRQVLAERLDLPLRDTGLQSAEPPMAELETQFERIVGTLFGIDSFLLSMPDASLDGTHGDAETADRPLPRPLSLRSVSIPPITGHVGVEPIAMRVPHDCYYVRSGSLRNYAWLRGFVRNWGGSLCEVVSIPTLDHGTRDTLERQLGIGLEASRRMGMDDAISDMAFIGYDLLFQDGAAVGVLFEAADTERVAEIIETQRHELLGGRPEATHASVEIAGRAVSLISSRDHSRRSFHAVDGRYHLVTNCERIVFRFLEASRGKDSLGQLNEFRYARSKVPSQHDAKCFMYLSDPFFRNLASPHYRIELRRRSRAVAELEQVAVAALAAEREKLDRPSIDVLKRRRFLPSTFALRSDGSRPVPIGGEFVDSIRGRRGTFLPVPDMVVAKASRGEIEDYARFAGRYRRQWRIADPVVVAISSAASADRERETVALKIRVTPYAKQRYAFLSRHLSPASTETIGDVPGDLLRLDAGLRDARGTQRVRVGLRDSEVPFDMKDGEMNPRGRFEGSTVVRRNYYAALTPGGADSLKVLERFVNDFSLQQSVSTKSSENFTLSLVLGGWFGEMAQTMTMRILRSALFKQRGIWTVAARNGSIRDEVLPQLFLNRDARPAQIRFQMSNVNEAAVAPYVHAYAYMEARKLSARNAQLLEFLSQQFGIPPSRAESVANRVLGAELICPLGGRFELDDRSSVPHWTSSDWATESYFEENSAPKDYRFPFLDWLRGVDLQFQLSPNSLMADVELVVSAAPEEDLAGAGVVLARNSQVRRAYRIPVDGDVRVRPVEGPVRIRVGDVVTVMSAPARLMIGETTIASLPTGTEFRVVQVKGNWIGIVDRREGKPIRGWLHVRDLGVR